MEKIIKRTISLTTKKRDSRNKLFEEFYSHDKNNAVFEFTVENGVPTEDIVVLFHFKRTNRHLEVRGRVDNDKIIVNFDTSLIIKDEQVAGYIYYENGEKSNDVYRFMFDVHVSEIDKEHDLPVMEMESKRIVPLTDIVTKSEITELLKKIVANEKLYDDTEIKQQIDLKADKEAIQAISSKVEALETKADNDTVYNDSELREKIATKADTQSVEAIAKRVETLENKPDNDTIYNDTELREKIESKADKEALLQYLPKSELTPISEKVESIESNIGRMATQQQLESYVSKNELEQKGYLTSQEAHNEYALKSEIPVVPNLDTINEKIRLLEEKPPIDLSYLATKKEIEDSHYLTEHQSLEGVVTKSELEQKGYLTAHQSLEDYSKKNELDRVTERVQSLEARPQVDTSKLVSKEELEQKNYLTTHQSLENMVTKAELEAKGYLTNHQDLSEYAKKAEIPPQFDSKPLTDRIDLLESKAIANGAYNDKPLLDKIHEVQESLKGFITQSSRYLTEHQSLAHLVTKDELESKGYITNHQSLEHLVTKDELEAKGYLKTHQSLENLVTKDELANKGYLTTHQDISGLVTKQELEDKHYLTAHQDVSNLATNTKVEAVENRVQTLENKPPVDLSNLATKDELEVVRNNQPKVDTSNLVTKQELDDKHYIQEHQSLANLVTKDELEAKGYLNAHQSLEEYAKKSEIPHIDTTGFASKEELAVVKQKQDTIKPETYVTKDELDQKGYLTAHQSLEHVVTKQELEAKGYLTNHQDISNLATNSKVSEVENRVNTLENAGFLKSHQDLSSYATKDEVTKKVDKEAFDTFKQDIVTHDELANKNYLTEHQSLANLVTKDELEAKGYLNAHQSIENLVTKEELSQRGYLTTHQSLADYARKSELPTPYNDSELREKISNIETNSVTKTELAQKGYLTAHQSLDNLVTKQELESKRYLTTHQSLAEYAKKSELPVPYNDSQILQRVKLLEQKPLAENGHSLTANIRMEGTYRNSVTNNVKIFVEVYYDGQKVTNGFTLKIKHKGGNNTDWGGFFTRNYTENGEVLNYDWGNREQNGTPLEVIVVIAYQGMSTTASSRLENVQDGLPINENFIPDSSIGIGYRKITWEDKVTNSGLQFDVGHALNNLGRGLHIWGTPNAEYKGLSTAPFPLVAQRGNKFTLSMDLGKDALREDSTLRLGIHYMNGTNQIVSQEWQDLDLSTQGFEIRKYKRISKTFTVGSNMTYCRVMIYATAGRLINFYIDNIKLERGEVATAWCPAYVDLRGATYRIAKGDINGGNVGATATIQASELLNPDGVKVGDMIEDWLAYSTGADKEIWTVIAVNGTTITVKSLAKRVFPYYNDSDIKRRISILESRPTFDTLTPSQRNSLKGEKGEKGDRGVAGENIVNQQNKQQLKYWFGSKSQYDAIRSKDVNTIYDVYE